MCAAYRIFYVARGARVHIANMTATKALFSSKKFDKIGIVPLLFVFDKYYPIID